MPSAKKRYYSTKEIQEMLGISRSKANAVMHMFEHCGQLFRDGRIMRVSIEVFEAYLAEKTIPQLDKRHY